METAMSVENARAMYNHYSRVLREERARGLPDNYLKHYERNVCCALDQLAGAFPITVIMY